MPTDFRTVALKAFRNGFIWLTPISPDGKQAILHGWDKYRRTNTEPEVNALADVYPHHNVGIISKSGEGGLFIIDIDKPGLIERLRAETGRTFPSTYTCRTRPNSAPYKAHLYFSQTTYSVANFEKQQYCGQYDLKGMGGSGYVLASGCVRGDEAIEDNNVPVIPIPDWLVDWLVNDTKQLKAAVREERRQEQAEKDAQHAAAVALQKQLIEDGLAVPLGQVSQPLVATGQRHAFLKWLAGTFISRGVKRERIVSELRHQCIERCEDGATYAVPERLRKIAFDPGLKKGKLFKGWTIQPKAQTGLCIKAPAQSLQRRLLQKALLFPNEISTPAVYTRLRLKSHLPKHRKLASRVMKSAGFRTNGRRNGTHNWQRVSQQLDGDVETCQLGHPDPLINHSITGDVTSQYTL